MLDLRPTLLRHILFEDCIFVYREQVAKDFNFVLVGRPAFVGVEQRLHRLLSLYFLVVAVVSHHLGHNWSPNVQKFKLQLRVQGTTENRHSRLFLVVKTRNQVHEFLFYGQVFNQAAREERFSGTQFALNREQEWDFTCFVLEVINDIFSHSLHQMLSSSSHNILGGKLFAGLQIHGVHMHFDVAIRVAQ